MHLNRIDIDKMIREMRTNMNECICSWKKKETNISITFVARTHELRPCTLGLCKKWSWSIIVRGLGDTRIACVVLMTIIWLQTFDKPKVKRSEHDNYSPLGTSTTAMYSFLPSVSTSDHAKSSAQHCYTQPMLKPNWVTSFSGRWGLPLKYRPFSG